MPFIEYKSAESLGLRVDGESHQELSHGVGVRVNAEDRTDAHSDE